MLVRAFLACELPSILQEAIQAATASLRATLGDDLIRWVPAYNIHLTLKFFGDISPPGVDLIEHMLASEADHWRACDVHVGGVGSFPGPRRPRVLWIGMKAPPSLASLQQDLESASIRLGYEPDGRTFSPHLTIGRVRQNATATDSQRIQGAILESQVGDLGTAHVGAIHLFKSDLQRTGPVYTKMFTVPLRND